MEWIAKLALLNMLWILFTLSGFLVFGFFPATVALLMVTRDIKRNNSKGIRVSYLQYFVDNFIQVNAYGFFIVTVNICFISLAIKSVNQFSVVFSVLIFVITVLVFLISLYILPVFTHFKASFVNHLKLSMVIALGHPVVSFVLFSLFAINFGIIFHSKILIAFPILFLFFMVSVSAYFATVVLTPVFGKFSRTTDSDMSSVRGVTEV
ncbi:YesL family protein [Gracilibacillus sp. D59]|uniref:YesL family protein n=1 Tax=Gracilibacillus sp. D59 TaxID=3457434 RepID=UPI003FCD84DE